MRSAAATLRLLGCYKRGTRRRRRRTGCARRTRLQGERSTHWRGSRLRIRLDLVKQRHRHVAVRSGREVDGAGLGHPLSGGRNEGDWGGGGAALPLLKSTRGGGGGRKPPLAAPARG